MDTILPPPRRGVSPPWRVQPRAAGCRRVVRAGGGGMGQGVRVAGSTTVTHLERWMKGGSVHSLNWMGQLLAWSAALTSSRFRYA